MGCLDLLLFCLNVTMVLLVMFVWRLCGLWFSVVCLVGWFSCVVVCLWWFGYIADLLLFLVEFICLFRVFIVLQMMLFVWLFVLVRLFVTLRLVVMLVLVFCCGVCFVVWRAVVNNWFRCLVDLVLIYYIR